MRRNSPNRILLLGAIFSALLGSISTEGLSLCFGPDAHVAVEVAGAGCCVEKEEVPSTPAMGRSSQDCGPCQDTPLSLGLGLTTHAVSAHSLPGLIAAAPRLAVLSCATIPVRVSAPIQEFLPPWDGLSPSTLRC